jgi:hypothetical protein
MDLLSGIIGMLILGGTGAGLYATFVKTRQFVRERLRFVDAAQRPSAPWIAGAATGLAAWPVFGILLAFLPAVGAATAVALGVTVGAAVRSGQKQVKLLTRG